MNATQETITPKKALAWLKLNTANRPMSQANVKKYAELMRAGKWELNGETIKFNCTDTLIDGQTRLTACVEAQVPFESYVVRGLPEKAFDTIDRGKMRNTSDVLARRGEKHYTILAAAGSLLTQWELTGKMARSYAARLDQIVDCIEANPDIRNAVHEARNMHTGSKMCMPSGVASFLLFLFSKNNEVKAKEFMSKVLLGENLLKSMPEFKLRTRLLDNMTAIAKLRSHVIVALAIKAWNSSISKKPMTTLGWKDGTEDFPVPV